MTLKDEIQAAVKATFADKWANPRWNDRAESKDVSLGNEAVLLRMVPYSMRTWIDIPIWLISTRSSLLPRCIKPFSTQPEGNSV